MSKMQYNKIFSFNTLFYLFLVCLFISLGSSALTEGIKFFFVYEEVGIGGVQYNLFMHIFYIFLIISVILFIPIVIHFLKKRGKFNWKISK